VFVVDDEPQRAPADRGGAEGRPGIAVEPMRLLGAVRRGKRTLIVSTLVAGALGILLAKTVIGQEFESQAVLQWTPPPGGDTGDAQRQLRTLSDSVKLPKNLIEVRHRNGDQSTLEALGKAVDVESSNQSNLVTISAKGKSAPEAVHLAETVVEVFLAARIEHETARLGREQQRLRGDLDKCSEELASARKVYDAFRDESGVTDLSAEIQAAIEQTTRLRAEADLADADGEAERARSKTLRSAARGEAEQTVLSEKELRPDERKHGEARADLTALEAQLGPDHPKVQALRAEVGALEERVAKGNNVAHAERTVGRNPRWDALQQSLSTSSAASDAARMRRVALSDRLELARARLDRLTRVEGRGSQLLLQVRAAEAHQAALQAAEAKAADLARSPGSAFVVLAPPTEPDRAAKSLRRPVVVAAPVLGFFLALLVLLARALRGLRVHTAAEIAFWGNAPVIASTTYPREAEAFTELIADLAQGFRKDGGTTLIAGFGPEEAELIDPIVRRLNQVVSLRESEGEAGEPFAAALDPTLSGPAQRRAVRKASRLLILVGSGQRSAGDLFGVAVRFGRADALAFVVLGVGPDLGELPDQAGDVARFWVRRPLSTEPPR
jgi:uncharacterized protein involved in exopolysaccharide biosynthesis